MFTEKELSCYQSIKAPEDLLLKIKRKQKISNIPARILAAAAVFLFLLSGIYFYSAGESDIIVNGQVLQESIVFYDTMPAMERNFSSKISFPIEIHPARKTRISVTKGSLSIDGVSFEKEVTISSDTTLWWELEKEEETLFTMELSDEKGIQEVTLKYENGKIIVTKEKKQ